MQHLLLDNLPSPIINNPLLPLVSIVTPSYNQGKFIRATIESVLTQDYPNIEYWVIDGGSTDETISILKEYEHDQRFHWVSEPDQGQSDAINKGLSRCRGEIFSWLNSDDCLLPKALHRVATAWNVAQQPLIIYGLARLIDHNGHDLGYCPSQSRSVNLDKLLWCKSQPMQPATFIPTDYVRRIGGVNISFHYAMDFDLWIRLVEHLPIKHIPYDLALCRLHTTAKTVALPAKFIDDHAEIFNQCMQRGLLSEKQARSRTHLFAAKVYLMPGIGDFSAALFNLKMSVANDYVAFPYLILILVKGMVRRILGEGLWAKVRFFRTRLS